VPMDQLVNPFGREKLENELLVTHLTLYQFLLYHKYARTYFPYIESYFHEIGIPQDFKYLAVAESSLRNRYSFHHSCTSRSCWKNSKIGQRRFRRGDIFYSRNVFSGTTNS
jgi:hypothetical protein